MVFIHNGGRSNIWKNNFTLSLFKDSFNKRDAKTSKYYSNRIFAIRV